MYVRRLLPGDAREVLRAAPLFDHPPDPQAVTRYLADDRNVFLLALEADIPVGFLRGTELLQLTSSRRQMFLYEVAVAEAHRRRGVGAKLVGELLHYCTTHGFDEVFVFTDDPANDAAERLYRSTGAVTETRGDRMYDYKIP
ncbi:MAG: GNAT family N-acetyltransferase [Thermoplasmata archaeon]